MTNSPHWHGTVEMVRRTMTSRGRANSGYYSIEGIRLHERALRAGQPVRSAVIAESINRQPSPRVQTLLHELQAAGCELHEVPDAVIAQLTDGRDLGGMLGVLPLPLEPRLEDLIVGGCPVLLVAAGIKDPGNTGALMRTALAAGAAGFVATGICDPYHPKAVRTSMGSLFKLPVLTFSRTDRALAALRAAGLQTVGLAVDGALLVADLKVAENGIAVIVGNEARGLGRMTRQQLDSLVSIPMRKGVDSYSVNAAAAIALYEVGRHKPRTAG